jgi:hypothetical protein
MKFKLFFHYVSILVVVNFAYNELSMSVILFSYMQFVSTETFCTLNIIIESIKTHITSNLRKHFNPDMIYTCSREVFTRILPNSRSVLSIDTLLPKTCHFSLHVS